MTKLLNVASAMLLTLTTAAATAVSANAASETGDKAKGWHFKQTMEYHGPLDITATDKGCKIRTKELCLYLQPGKGCTVVNDTTKTIAKMNRDVWLSQKSLTGLTAPAPAMYVKQYHMPQKSPRIIAGHKCSQHYALAYRKDHSFYFWWEYWTTPEIKLPKDLLDDYLAMMQLPPGNEFPIEAYRHIHPNSPNYKKMVFLQTSEAIPTTVTASSLIAPTKGFKPVRDELDMMLGTGGQGDELSEVLEGKKK